MKKTFHLMYGILVKRKGEIMELWILLPLVSSLLTASVNVVDKFFVLEGDDNLTTSHFVCMAGMQILIFSFLFTFDPINLMNC